MNSNKRWFVLPVGIALFALTGCSSLGFRNARQHQSSSIVQFLYPDQKQPLIQPSVPVLRLPLRVGIAFVPPAASKYGYYGSDLAFPEAKKTELMRKITADFKALPFVQSIEVIPTTYLRPGGGFENLDQLRGLMGIDVVVLIAYDQAQVTSDTAWTLAYWTIVGAYVVQAQKNDTHTLMEAVVYDISSRKLLFRAPGISTVNKHSTIIEQNEELRADSARSFNDAAQDLTINLKSELEAFKVRIKEAPEEVRIERKPGYTGGGATEAWFAAALTLLLLPLAWRKRA